jgi:hypothetical protein
MSRPESPFPEHRRLGVALVVLALVVYWAGASYGIKSPFYYGHYGYHGGSYATWARGTLRHHTIYPVNEPGFATPQPGTYYIHHPVLTHQLVTLTFALFGQHEWSVRLGAILPSLASLLLAAAIAWRASGPLVGGAAALTFALVPINIWYEAHIDQGFPSIAFLLAFFWFYLAWLRTGSWRTGGAALVCQAMAGNFEWSPYFACLPIFGHVAWTGWRRRGRYLTFALLHPLAAIVPLAFHFWLVSRAKLLDDLMAAFRTRTAEITYAAFQARMREYADTLFGRALLAVMLGWLLLVIVRFLRGRGRSVDLVGFTFAFTVVVYMHVFKNAVVTHAYRQLYGNVWAAMAVAGLVVEVRWLASWFFARLPLSTRSARATVAALVALVATLGFTAPVSWAGLVESRLHGGVPGWLTFNPDLRQTALAMHIEHTTTPADKLYLHPSFAWPPPHRMDWAYYYDRDLRRWTSMRELASLPAEQRKHAVGIFFPAELQGDELRALAELAAHHPVWTVDGMAVVDLRVDAASLDAYHVVPTDLGWMGRVPRLEKLWGGPKKKVPGAVPLGEPGRSFVEGWLMGPYPPPRLTRDEQARNTLATRLKAALPPARVVQPPARKPIGKLRIGRFW